MLVEQEQASDVPEYKEEPVVEREQVYGVLNYCFKNVEPTEEYFLHQCNKEKIEGLMPTRPYYVPIEFLSCLNEGGAEVSFGIGNCLAKISYGENKDKTAYKRLLGVFKGKLSGEDVSGVMLGSCVEPSIKDPPNASDSDDVRKIREIFERVSERASVIGIDYL
jgi:hypothetical protein